MEAIEQAFLCTAWVNLNVFWFEVSDQENELTNPHHPLVTAFTIDCERDREKNYACGLIDPVIFQDTASSLSNLAASSVSHLDLPRGSILCLEGRKRILAAKTHLREGDRWWIVRLYSDSR